MKHFAQVQNGVVLNTIVAEPEFVSDLPDSASWIECDPDSHEGRRDDGQPHLRYNAASMGDLYDADADAFYSPPKYDYMILNRENFSWEYPTPEPTVTEDQVAKWRDSVYQETGDGWVVLPTEGE